MTQPPNQKSPAERVLDLAVYGPLGLALSIAEAMPAMARKGRSRLGPRVGLARTVGQLAVRQGYKQLRGIAASGTAIPFRPPAAAGADQGPGRHRGHEPGPALRATAVPRTGTARTTARTAAVPPVAAAPGASELAIPSYDSLSAPQVVQRLAGLSYDEVVAVRAYEAATRGRRTILSRAEQLLG
jgi:hypothetical protein